MTCGNGYFAVSLFVLIMKSFFGDINFPVQSLNPLATCLCKDNPLFFLALIICVPQKSTFP